MAFAILAASAVALLALSPQARALDCAGVDLDDGCLFTITGGDTTEPDDGYAVTNASDVPLWDFVRARDLQAIGYPISQRWVDGPFTLQAFQKVILQWDPGKGRMNYYNTLDVIANRYPDVELPNVPPHQVLEADRGADFATVTQNHLALLDQTAAIKERFLSEPDWLNLYGLPIRYEEREVDGHPRGLQMLRAQRTVFEIWNVPAPGTAVGRVNLQNVPDKVKRLTNVIIPDGAKAPVTRDAAAGLPSFMLSTPTPILESVANQAIDEIVWVQDGLSYDDAYQVQQLRELATLSPTAFWALVRNPGIHATSSFAEDLRPTRTVGDIIGLIVLLARTYPIAAGTVATMPFLQTFDGHDLLPLWTVLEILWFSPGELEATISHLTLTGGLTEEQKTSLPLLHLKLNHPEAGRAIEALPWIQDGISPPPRDRDGNPSGIGSEARMVRDMMQWQLRGYRGHLLTLLSRPWFQDGLDRREHLIVYKMMSEIAPHGTQTSLRILRMPFLETIGEGDLLIVDILYSAAFGGHLRNLLSQPSLQGGIVDGQVATVALEYLGLRDSSAAATLRALPWIRDGVAFSEVDHLLALQRIALESRTVFHVVASKTWVLDGINRDELSTIDDLAYISAKDDALALRIVEMPFLITLDVGDASLVAMLAHFSDNESRRYYLNRVLSHSTIAGSIRDEHADLVTALLSSATNASPATQNRLLATLLNPTRVIIEERTVALPHTGEVVLAVVRTRDSPSNSMSLLERAVHSHEEFMAAPFPVNYVSMLVADVARSEAGADGFIKINVSSYSDFTPVIAHEAAHIYWSHSPRWLQEGGASFLEWITLKSPQPLYNFMIGVDTCSGAHNLAELEANTPSIISGSSICQYSMGFGLFFDLYKVLGDVEFRRGFREMYLKLLADTSGSTSSEEWYRTLDRNPAGPECAGSDRSPCVLRAAFLTSAPDPAVGAVAWHYIHRWYYGPQAPAQ